jgi:hypothetical protein
MQKHAVAQGYPWQDWRAELLKSGVMSERRRLTLTAGTELPGTQVWCFEINLNHPLLAGEEMSNVVHLKVV